MWQGYGGGAFFFFPVRSLFLSVLTISLNSHLSFLFKACIGVGLGSWFDLGMVVGWDWLMMGLDWRGSVIFLNGFNCGLLCLFFFLVLTVDNGLLVAVVVLGVCSAAVVGLW